MEDKKKSTQSQPEQASAESVEKPVREFVQVDTSSNAYMDKEDKSKITKLEILKDN